MHSHWRNLISICFLLIFLSSCNEMKTEEIFETAVCTEETESKIEAETDTEEETGTDTQETVNILILLKYLTAQAISLKAGDVCIVINNRKKNMSKKIMVQPIIAGLLFFCINNMEIHLYMGYT